MNKTLRSIALLAVGTAVGFLTAQLFEDDHRQAHDAEQVASPVPSLAEAIPPNPSDGATAATATVDSEAVDFQGRYRDLRQLPNGPEKIKKISGLFEAWGAAEGETAYRFAKQLSGRDRLAYLASAAKGWAKVAPRPAWAATMDATNDGAMLTRMVGEVVDELAQQDPALAMELLFDVGSHWNRNRLLPRVLNSLETTEDHNRLLASLLTSESEGSGDAVKALFHSWGRYDTEAPLAAVASISDSDLAHTAVLGILEGWATADGQGAFDYIVGSGDAQLIKDALAPVAKEWARSSTADEMGEVFSAISAVENSDAIIKNLVADLARADPQLAMASAMSLNDESAQANHARDALSIWADANLDEAEAYFKALPPGQTKNYAIWGLFNPAIHKGASPERIIDHAASLGDIESIGRALFSMAEYTRVADLGKQTDQLAVELESYVTAHPDLPPETKDKILGNLAKRGDQP